MRTFACVAECGSFAAAARSLNVAPSVVTRAVADLEHALGARLFYRTTRHVSLTPIGQSYLPRVLRILREMDEAFAAVSDSQHGLRGRVRVAAPQVFAARALIPRLPRLQANHPEIVVDLLADGAAQTLQAGDDIRIVVQAGRLDGDFIAHSLASAGRVLCAAPAYLRRRGTPRHPTDLGTQALLLATTGHAEPSLVMTHAMHHGAIDVPAGRSILGGVDLVQGHAAALAGIGIVALPSFAVQAELDAGRLERVLADWHLPELHVFACLPSRKQVPLAVRAVLDFLRAEFPGPGRDPWLPAVPPGPPSLRLAA